MPIARLSFCVGHGDNQNEAGHLDQMPHCSFKNPIRICQDFVCRNRLTDPAFVLCISPFRFRHPCRIDIAKSLGPK